MMETFIVLGLCFILYEALDLFQSCYNNNRHNHHSNFGGATVQTDDGTDSYTTNNNNETKDTSRLIMDAISEVDSVNSSSNSSVIDDNDQNQLITSSQSIDVHRKVFSISDTIESYKISG